MIRLYPTKKLTKADIQLLIPTIHNITTKVRDKQYELSRTFMNVKNSESARDRLDAEMDLTILNWRRKMSALGGIPGPHYEVRFETTTGTFLYKSKSQVLSKIKPTKGAV